MKQFLTKNIALALVVVAIAISTVGVTYAAISSYGNILSPWVVDANPVNNYVSFGYRRNTVSGVDSKTFAYRNDISIFDIVDGRITETCQGSYAEYTPTLVIARVKPNDQIFAMAGSFGKAGCTYSLKFQTNDGTWYWIPWDPTNTQVVRGKVVEQVGITPAPREVNR